LLTDKHYDILEYLIENQLSLISIHLPMDGHKEYGHNSLMLSQLGAKTIEEFAFYKGKNLGYLSCFEQGLSLDDIITTLFPSQNMLSVLNFGKKINHKIAVVSGSGTNFFDEFIQKNCDVLITGDASHQLYHSAKEYGVNIIFGGHYNSEVFALKYLEQKIKKDLNIETQFLNLPTGL